MFLSLWSFIMNRCILLNKHVLKGQLHCLQSVFIDTVLHFAGESLVPIGEHMHTDWGRSRLRILAVPLKTVVTVVISGASVICAWPEFRIEFIWVAGAWRVWACTVGKLSWWDGWTLCSSPLLLCLQLWCCRSSLCLMLPPVPPVACESPVCHLFFNALLCLSLCQSLNFCWFFYTTLILVLLF